MTQWDAPNQQVVRADQSAPWEEGTGGNPGDGEQPVGPQPPRGDRSLDEMTKAQLHAHADELGIEVHEDMTKAEIRQAIEEAD